MKKRNIFSLFTALLFLPFLGKSQTNTEKEWKIIDSLIGKANQPKTALVRVNKLYQESHAKNNVEQSIKALAYKYTLDKRVTDKDESENTLVIDQALVKPINALERSLLWFMKAGAYVNYYNRFQYKIQSRNDTLAHKDSDWATWTLKDFQWKIYRAYQNALDDSVALQQATIKQYPSIVQFGNVNELRPTLYDLVVNSAIDFYQGPPRFSWERGSNSFELKSDSVLRPLPVFLQYNPQTSDSVSVMGNIISLYQRLFRFHLKQDAKDALIDADNRRIDWVYKNLYDYTLVDKDSTYLDAARYLIQTYPNNPQTLQSVYMVANYYNLLANKYNMKKEDSIYQNKRITALSYIDKYLPKDTLPTYGWYNLAILKESITKPKVVEITMEKVNMSNEPILALLKFYHLPKAYLKIVSLQTAQPSPGFTLGDSLILHNKVMQQSAINFPKSTHYQSYTTEIKIDPLPVGQYLMCLSSDEKSKESRVYIGFQVSDLAYFTNNGDYFVVNRKTGKPIEGVKYELDKKTTTDPIDFKRSKLVSDKDGHIVVRALKKSISNYSSNAYIFKGKDTLTLRDYSTIPTVTETNKVENVKKMDSEELEEEREDNMKMLYFTDRNIYRPGQNIHFKSVVYTKDDEDSAYHIYNRKDSITFYLNDVNNKKVDSLRLKTDDFGSVSGVFCIPSNVLTGRFSIDNKDNSDDLSIQVEEYKRPTFFVEIDSVKGTYRLNDSMPITGTAKAYNGSKVSNASVKLHIQRTARFPYYWLRNSYYYSNKKLLDTVIRTDAQGRFKIVFKVTPDESVDSASLPVFQYAIHADVTDNNGETRSKQSLVAVGYNSVDVQWNIGEKAKLLSINDVRAFVKNTNGISVACSVKVKIQPIQQPKNLLRQKYWSQPDVQIMDSLTYKQYFPHDIYKNETDIKNWTKESPILETTVASDSLLNYKGKLPAGWYYLEANITSPEGKPLKDIRYVQILPEGGMPLTDNYLDGFNGNCMAYVGDTVKQYLSTAAEDMYLTQITQNDKEEIAYSNQLISKQTLPIITILNEKSNAALGHTFAGYKDNRFYQEVFSIEVLPKRVPIDIKFKSFRDNIEPGSKEKWSVQVIKDRKVVNDGQLMSAMYDASLDQILKGNWRFYVNNAYQYGNTPSFSSPFDNTSNGYGLVQTLRNPFGIHYPQLTFENGNLQLNGGMDEVVVVGYGTSKKMSFSAGATSIVEGNSTPVTATALLGKVSGVSVSDKGSIVLRGVSSISNNNTLYIVDGQVLSDGEANIPPSDIEVINIYKPADAVAIYGSRAANGAVLITTKSKSYGKKTPPVLRSNFSETAFFYPSLTADKDGNYWIEFTMPDAVTQWRWRNLSMDKDLHFGYSEMMITSKKTLMIQPNMPRFLRAGDQLVLTAKISNTGAKDLEGKAFIQLMDADSNVLHWQKIDQTNFKVAADQSSTVAFDLVIPFTYSGPLYVKVWAEGGQFSDGEQHEIPVLSRQTLVTETLPFELKGDTVAHMAFTKLLASDSSNTLQNKNLSIELATNPVWYAVQAIPYLQSYPYECSEQVFGRMYGGFLANKITHMFPQIKSVLNKWENDPEALKSNLQKNGELKQALLEETPWLNVAESEAAQKRKLALYFNTDSVNNLLQKNFDLLAKRQLSDGSFSWYEGNWGDRYITQNIMLQYARLQSLQAVDKKWQEKFAPIIKKAQQYLSGKISEDFANLKKWKSNLNSNNTSASQLMYLYALAQDSAMHKYTEAENYYLNQSKKYWNGFSNIQKAWIAEIFYRKGDKSFAVNTVIRSLMENAVESKTNGTYWKSDFDWGFGYLSNIETQSQMMTIINQIANKQNDSKLKDQVEEMQHWLIRNKQTNYWSNTKATADACYALLTANTKWSDAAPKISIQMGDTVLNIGQQEAGTGYAKITIPQNAIRASLGKITVGISANPGYVYGGVYWQYLENMDKITPAQSPLTLAKTFYKETITNGENHLQEVKAGDVLKVGDKLVVRIVIKADRDMQYVHLKDLRPSNTEPDDAISGYQYKNNMGYYLSIKDVSSNFFFNTVSKGSHILDYTIHVTHAGNFSSGIASVQCMYAPEMNSHSEGTILDVK